MARYSPELLERIKRETDLLSLVTAKSVKLKKQGNNYIGLCPFHNDKIDSFVLTRKDGIWLWNCLGACNCGGDVIAWVMKSEGVSFRHAVEILLEMIGGNDVAAGEKIVKKSTVPLLSSPIDTEADNQTALNQVIDYYHETLLKTPAALDYLQMRGIDNKEAIETFSLGFADRTLGLRLPKRNRKEGAQIRERLIDLGIIRESGHEHFNGCLVFPVIDEEGIITEIYGRKINDGIRKGTAYHLYLPGPHKGIWNPKALVNDKIILCESIIDALTFWCNGYRNVTASYGVNGFTDEMLQTLLDYKISTVHIAYDRDEAGNKAAEKLAQKLMGCGISCFRITFPRNMDANSYAVSVQPAEKSLQVLVNSAQWMGNGHKKQTEEGQNSVVQVQNSTRENSTVPSPACLAAKEEQGGNGAVGGAEVSLPVAGEEAEKTAAKEKKGDEPAVHLDGDLIELSCDSRAYRIIGLERNRTFGVLKINLRIMAGDVYHVDTLDLYNYRSRVSFIRTAAMETKVAEDIIKADVGKILLKLEELQEQNIKKAREPEKKEFILSEGAKREALSFLKRDNLLECILKDFESCGVVGESSNKLIGYLACVSRNLQKPLGIIIQSSSAAGKTHLMESILSFIPRESWKKYSSMTGQSLFYMGETDLKYKILAIVEEEGAERASYSLKLLQSEGELTIASTGKDPISGKLVTREYRIEGPVVIIITTTSIEIDEELQNRCIILTVDEDRSQTRSIQRLQRELETIEGLRSQQDWDRIRTVHQNAQRLLRPLTVVNPYARYLTFLDTKTRTRRDHMKYLTLIKTIALLHQYQRPIKTDFYRNKPTQYIEATLDDIAIANELAGEFLGRSLDELPPQTRRFLFLIDEHVTKQCDRKNLIRRDYRFSRRELRETLNWSHNQIRVHVKRLIDFEYVLVHRGKRGQSFEYELLYDGKGKDGKPFLVGLLDVETLRTMEKEQNASENSTMMTSLWGEK